MSTHLKTCVTKKQLEEENSNGLDPIEFEKLPKCEKLIKIELIRSKEREKMLMRENERLEKLLSENLSQILGAINHKSDFPPVKGLPIEV